MRPRQHTGQHAAGSAAAPARAGQPAVAPQHTRSKRAKNSANNPGSIMTTPHTPQIHTTSFHPRAHRHGLSPGVDTYSLSQCDGGTRDTIAAVKATPTANAAHSTVVHTRNGTNVSPDQRRTITKFDRPAWSVRDSGLARVQRPLGVCTTTPGGMHTPDQAPDPEAGGSGRSHCVVTPSGAT